MQTTIQIFEEDKNLVNQSYDFHWFHKWSKWYRIRVAYNRDFNSFFAMIKQQRECIICHKIQQSEVKNVSS